MSKPLLEELPAPPKEKTGWPWTEESDIVSKNIERKHWPKLTVVTPSYNQAEFLEETIRSVLLQGYPNLEYIIIDGGSTDNSVKIIKKYERWLTYWISEKDKGQSHAVNKGFKRATGEIIGWLNSDDYYEKNIFEMVARSINAELKRFIVTGDTMMVNSVTRERRLYPGAVPDFYSLLFHDRLHRAHLPVKLPQQPSTFFHKEVLERVGLLNTDLYFAMDYDYWLRAVFMGYSFECLPFILSYYRFHPQSKSYKGWEGDWEQSLNDCQKAAALLKKSLRLTALLQSEFWWLKQYFKSRYRVKKF